MGAKESDDLYTKLEEIDDGKGYNEEIKRFEEGDEVLKEFCERNNSSEETSQRKDNVVGKKIQMFSLQHSSISEVYSSSSLTKEDIRNTDPAASKLSQLHSSESGFVRANSIALDPSKTAQRLKIAMLVVGTRGDVQPFLAVAKKLQEFGHHVRLATHINFSNFVKAAGVEFYPLGGDPRVLAGYMARNKGLPSAAGELSIQRKQLKAIMESILPACTEPDVKTGAPFTAQAIIANPPAYGQTHVAEALNIPLHILFTVPWTPTYEFPNPIAHLPQSPGNRLSYIIIDLLIWWIIRGQINEIRETRLKLPPISYFSTYNGSIYHLPTTYMWSRHVLPKPKDWGPEVDVVGYCFLNLGSMYHPQEELIEWIKKGSKPIYVGFGSMSLIRLDGVKKMVAKNRAENRQCIHFHNIAADYVLQQTERINMRHEHALASLSRELGETKENLKGALVTNTKLYAENDRLWKLSEEMEQHRLAKEESDARAVALEAQNNELKKKLEEQEAAAKAEAKKLRQLAFSKFLEGETSMVEKVEEAWGMGPNKSAPFSYFWRRLDYVDKKKTAEILNEEPPSHFQYTDDEGEDEVAGDEDIDADADSKRDPPAS